MSSLCHLARFLQFGTRFNDPRTLARPWHLHARMLGSVRLLRAWARTRWHKMMGMSTPLWRIETLGLVWFTEKFGQLCVRNYRTLTHHETVLTRRAFHKQVTKYA